MRSLRLAVAAAFLTMFSVTADAQRISFKQTIVEEARRQNGSFGAFRTVSLPLFDPALGTLRAATFTLDVSFKSSVTYDATLSDQGPTFFSGFIDVYGAFVAPSDPANDFVIPLPFFNQYGFSYTFQRGAVGTIVDSYFDRQVASYTDAYTLTNLVSGEPLDFSVFELGEGLVEIFSTPSPRLRNLSFDRSITLSVAYDYGVPEPATWAMLIVGFGAVGGALRLRRRVEPRPA